MYKYKVVLVPEKKLNSISFQDYQDEDGETATAIVEEAIERFNERTTNKQIVDHEIGRYSITVNMESQVYMKNPALSLKLFIRELISHQPFQEIVTSAGRVFRSESVLLEQTEENEPEIKALETDEELMKAIVEVFYRPTPENLQIKNQIRAMLEAR